MQAGAAPGPLRVPKVERLSPTPVCGESGCPQDAPYPAGSLNQTQLLVFFLRKLNLFFIPTAFN